MTFDFTGVEGKEFDVPRPAAIPEWRVDELRKAAGLSRKDGQNKRKRDDRSKEISTIDLMSDDEGPAALTSNPLITQDINKKAEVTEKEEAQLKTRSARHSKQLDERPTIQQHHPAQQHIVSQNELEFRNICIPLAPRQGTLHINPQNVGGGPSQQSLAVLQTSGYPSNQGHQRYSPLQRPSRNALLSNSSSIYSRGALVQ